MKLRDGCAFSLYSLYCLLCWVITLFIIINVIINFITTARLVKTFKLKYLDDVIFHTLLGFYRALFNKSFLFNLMQ